MESLHDSMGRLEELQVQKELKEVIRGILFSLRALLTPYCPRLRSADHVIEYIHNLYDGAYPGHHGIDVLVCRHKLDRFSTVVPHYRRNTTDSEYIMIRALVYTESEHKTCKLLAESSKAHYGITPALQEFTKDLERQMAAFSMGGQNQFNETSGYRDREESDTESRKRHVYHGRGAEGQRKKRRICQDRGEGHSESRSRQRAKARD